MSGPLGDLPPASPPRGRHLRSDSSVSTDEYVQLAEHDSEMTRAAGISLNRNDTPKRRPCSGPS